MRHTNEYRDALEVSNLDVLQGHDEERELNNVDEAVNGGLQEDAVAIGDTVKPELVVGDVELNVCLHSIESIETGRRIMKQNAQSPRPS